MLIGRMTIASATVAGALLVASGSAQAQRRSDADYTQGLQQSALAFAAQSQWRGADASNRYIAGRRLAGRMYDEPPVDPRYSGRSVYVRPFWR